MAQRISPTQSRSIGLAGRFGPSSVAARIEDEVRVTAADLIDSVSEARLKVVAARYKVEDGVRTRAVKLGRRVKAVAGDAREKFGDEARFLRSLLDDPRRTGSVTPSSPALARKMASFVDPSRPGVVVEIGPGTGPVTEALIERGIEEKRLVLIEFSPEFCALLRQRFPEATVIEGDAYALSETLAGVLDGRPSAIVSSLPLFNRPPEARSAFARQAFAMLADGAPLIQFTYSMISPVPRRGSGLTAFASDWVLRNIPPARVWVYRKPA